jgi:hypothetical protein
VLRRRKPRDVSIRAIVVRHDHGGRRGVGRSAQAALADGLDKFNIS